MKPLISLCLFFLFGFSASGQLIRTQEIDSIEHIEAKTRARAKVKSVTQINISNKDTSIERFNRNGYIINTWANGFNVTIYEYNDLGRRISCSTVLNKDTIINWEANYQFDSVLTKVRWDLMMDFSETIFYDKEERKTKSIKRYRDNNRIDSTIYTYNSLENIETNYKNGAMQSFSSTTKGARSDTTRFYLIHGQHLILQSENINLFDKKNRKIEDTRKLFKNYDNPNTQNLSKDISVTTYQTNYYSNGLEKETRILENGKQEWHFKYYYKGKLLTKSSTINKGSISENIYTYGKNNLLTNIYSRYYSADKERKRTDEHTIVHYEYFK